MKPEVQSVALFHPEQDLGVEIRKIVVAIVTGELNEKLHVVPEVDIFQFGLLFGFLCPSADFLANLIVVKVGIRNDAQTTTAVEVDFAFWVDPLRPLCWKSRGTEEAAHV